MRVLVVEDEVRLARHIASALTEAGDDPVVVHDGEEALHQAVGKPFDLIVLDIGLPRIDGFEVLRRLRARHVSSRVLILTARGQVTDRVSGLELGADDYLAKPFATSVTRLATRTLNPADCQGNNRVTFAIRRWERSLTILGHENNGSQQ